LLSIFKKKESSTQVEAVDPLQSSDLLINAISKQMAIIQFSPDGTILEANDNFLSIMGYTQEAIKNKHHSIFCSPETRNSEDYKSFWKKLAQGTSFKDHFLRVTQSGEKLWLEASYCPVFDKDNHVIKVVKIATDTTELVNDVHELKSQKNALSRSQAIIEFDLEGHVLTANENFLSTMGYKLDEIIGKHHSHFCSDEITNSKDYKTFWAELRNGEFVAGKFQRIASDGHPVWLEASYNPIFDSTGKQYKVIKFSTDISDSVLKAQETDRLALQASEETEASAQKGLEVGEQAIGVMTELVQGLTASSDSIRSLNEQSERITNIVNTISEIADQTNLLALNAAIEAARAGEQGRGFAVVADEVRQLAARTSNSTSEIDEVVKRNHQMASGAMSTIESAMKQSITGEELIKETGDAIQQITRCTTELLQALKG
jgi:methyl-accepting chemotaxis protein